MESKIIWVKDKSFLGVSGSGHSLVLGSTSRDDGKSLQPSPMELLLMGMGGCSAYDVIDILEKTGVPIKSFEIFIHAERSKQDPKVFTDILLIYKFGGEKVLFDDVRNAVDLSIDKYCSASAMISKTADIKYKIEFLED